MIICESDLNKELYTFSLFFFSHAVFCYIQKRKKRADFKFDVCQCELPLYGDSI